jgi:hypothetical protein
MIDRIIYCALSSLAMLGPLPHETLLKRDDGIVAAVQDETILALLYRQAAVSLLYFSRRDYEQAIRGLSDTELDALLRKRRQDWTPNAAGHGINWLYQSERRCLTLTALAYAAEPTASAVGREDHFEQSLNLLVSISGETRYQDINAASLLVLVIEGEAKLRNEYANSQEAARQAADPLAAERFAAAVKRSEGYGRTLGSWLKTLGRPEYAEALPHVGLGRGVFIQPRDPALLNSLAAQREIHVIWKDGLVANWSLEDLPELEKRGKTARVLYFSTGQLLMDMRDLTPPQLQREFAQRLAAGRGGAMEARREYLCSLWLEQHLLRRKTLAQTRALAEAQTAILARQVTEEAQALRQELAARPVWLAEAEPSGSNGFEALKKSEGQLIEDARFLAALCRWENDANGERLFTRVSVFQPAKP